MENPASWNKTIKTIHSAISDHTKHLKEGMIGGSLELAIYSRLLTEGLLKESQAKGKTDNV